MATVASVAFARNLAAVASGLVTATSARVHASQSLVCAHNYTRPSSTRFEREETSAFIIGMRRIMYSSEVLVEQDETKSHVLSRLPVTYTGRIETSML